jgi:putative nucleotidyltransferase with HDIG domain
MQILESFFEGLDKLPPLPRNLAALSRLLGRQDVSLDEVVELVQYDPVLTAQILRVCNSAYYARGDAVTDLYEGALLIGFEEIFQLVTALSASAFMQARPEKCRDENAGLWEHSVASALAGKFIALDLQDNPSLVFAACVLHDIGKIALWWKLEGEYEELLAESRRGQTPLRVLERNHLGFDHAEVGGELLRHWKFPPELVAAVRYHHDPAGTEEHRRIASYTCLGDKLAWFMGFGAGDPALELSGRTEALHQLGLDASRIPHYMARCFFALREMPILLEVHLAA